MGFSFVMKKNILLCFIIFFSSFLFAQSEIKRTNHWFLGYESASHNIDTLFGNSHIDFNKKPLKAKYKYLDMGFTDDVATISDTSGKLLFYTNGIYIADSTHQPMKNGKGLNPGISANQHPEDGYICPQGSIILPMPNSSKLFYIFHVSVIHNLTTGLISGERLYYTLVDMSKNNGKGEVIEKNKIIFDKLLDFGKITACRHANGIDWWILMADSDTKNINTLLLSSKGIEDKGIQKFSFGEKGSVGQAVFSPDGTKYARFQGHNLLVKNQLLLYDFDRCTGKLSNQREQLFNDSTFVGGLAFSPNSRFLYVIETPTIFQMDTYTSNLQVDTVAIHNGFVPKETGLPARFRYAQLASDNKIYIATSNSSTYLHLIHEPDKKGKACNVEQHGFKLPTFNYTTIPNFPNFRLGAAVNNCITSTDEMIDENFKIYPNPTSDYLYLSYDKEKLQHSQLIVSDVQGKILLQNGLENDEIDVHNFPKGIYFLQILKENKVVFREKVVIIE